MLRWLKSKFTKVVYFPEDGHLGYADDAEWDGVMEGLLNGYKTNPDVFKAIQLLLHRKLAQIKRCPEKGSEARADWIEEQRGLAREVELLSYLVRLPIYAQQVRKRKEKTLNKEETENTVISPFDMSDS